LAGFCEGTSSIGIEINTDISINNAAYKNGSTANAATINAMITNPRGTMRLGVFNNGVMANQMVAEPNSRVKRELLDEFRMRCLPSISTEEATLKSRAPILIAVSIGRNQPANVRMNVNREAISAITFWFRTRSRIPAKKIGRNIHNTGALIVFPPPEKP
jgi:hypothetical protein